MIRGARRLLCTLFTNLLLFAPALVVAQEEPAEEPPPPPSDVAEVAGVWWARIGDSEFQTAVFAALVNIAAIIIISAIVYFGAMALLGRVIRRVDLETTQAVQPYRRRKQRIGTVLELVRSIIQWVIIITSSIWILASAGMDIRPVLAGAGILGLAVGFGSQNLVRDIVSGFFVLLEGQYAVGDYVQIGTSFGMVESVGMRVTVLKDLDNQRHFMPNGTIMQVTVYEEPFVNKLIEVPLANAEQCDAGNRVVAETISRLQEEYNRYLVYHEPPTSLMCDSAGALIRVPVATFPTQDWFATEEIPASLTDALAAAEIPLREGRTIRVYLDLSRMPEYHHADDSPDGEVV
ncbi:MAG: mechanosensitive ion channel family protein [Armatimonadota bacterium]